MAGATIAGEAGAGADGLLTAGEFFAAGTVVAGAGGFFAAKALAWAADKDGRWAKP